MGMSSNTVVESHLDTTVPLPRSKTIDQIIFVQTFETLATFIEKMHQFALLNPPRIY